MVCLYALTKLVNVLVDQIVAQVVKPALFELVLAAAISVFLFGIYHLAINGHHVLNWQIQKIKST
jgi:uncharacterized membrane protein YvlD (DUF360 family)